MLYKAAWLAYRLCLPRHANDYPNLNPNLLKAEGPNDDDDDDDDDDERMYFNVA